VVHHALCNVLEPIWERSFIFDSYANRLRKGTHRAILRCHEFARENPYVLQCDIQKFFPSIDHSILREMIARKTPNPGVLWVIDQILVSGLSAQTEEPQMRWFPGDDLFSPLRPRGLPIGNLTSQFWANVYLNGFDHFVKRELRCKAYVRYVDDFLLFSHSKEVLWDWAEAIARKMDGLRLNLHPLQVFPVRTGIPFLGFRIFPTHRRLKKKRGIAFQKRFRWKYDQMCRDEIPRDNLDTTVRSWVAHASWGDTWGLRRKILGKYVLPPTKRELRMKKE
jgi:retron-type reverse transcriptase